MTVETLAWGYGLIEGPRHHPDGGLFFSDVLKGGVYRLAPDGSTEVVVPRRRGVGGIALHAEGGLVISGRNVCHVRDGQTRVLFERADIGGFNDLFADAAGRIYTGSIRDDPFRMEGERVTGEAYRINAEGDAIELYAGVGVTNGIGISPDGRSLYHVDSTAGVLVHPDRRKRRGRRRKGELFARVSPGVPDGLVVDEDGGVWVAVYGGGCVTRFTATGALRPSTPCAGASGHQPVLRRTGAP